MKWVCSVCNVFVYDEEKGDPSTGIDVNTPPQDFPNSWRCPVCGAPKNKLIVISEIGYRNKIKVYEKFSIKKQRKEFSILVGVDNPETLPELAQEYGRSLGLRGIGQGFSFKNNLRALSHIKLTTRLISEHKDPTLEVSFFGIKIGMPVLGAPMSGLSYVSNITEEDFAYHILEGCRLAGTIGCTGTTAVDYEIHPGIKALQRVKGHGINIFKPQSQQILVDLMKQSEEEKAIAVGVDVDGAGSVNFSLAGKPVFRKTVDDLRELKRSTNLPFIVKGIMCGEDALSVVESGADIIGVSNHGGRVLDSTPGVSDVHSPLL